MKLRAFVSSMVVAGRVPSALARMPFEADFAARDLGEQQRGVVDNQKVSVGTAGQ
jgi:hypothetical protein